MTTNNLGPLTSWEGPYFDYGVCVSLNKSTFTLLQLPLNSLPQEAKDPHLEAGPWYSHVSQGEIFPSAPLVMWRIKNRDYRSNLIIKQMI